LQEVCEYASEMASTTTLILGHRGSPRRARENTVEAFALAREDGADGVELDVHRTADGELMVHHDADAPGLGVIAGHPFAVVRERCPWMPTLTEVLDECRGLLVNIEIKNSPADADFDPHDAVAQGVVTLLHSRRGVDEVIVSSFHLPAIERVHALDPAIPTGCLVGLQVAPLEALGIALTGGHRAIHPFFGMLADTAAATVMEEAHTIGLSVNAWTVNDPAEIVRLAGAGVDAIITDVPAEARAALG
jgi:glycerophosphoryl diester phosphodiesterase